MPKTYNGFNYAMSNPINLSDPTGFQASPGIAYMGFCFDFHTLEPKGLGGLIPLGLFVTAQQAVDICRAAYSSANWATVPIRGFDFQSDLPPTAHDLFGWFLYDHRGNHTDRLVFDANQPSTQELAKTAGVDTIRGWYYTGQLNDEGLREYQFNEWQQFQSILDLSNSLGNESLSISMVMGSYWFQVKKLNNSDRVGFRIDNDTTLSSGSHVAGRFGSGGYFESVEHLIHEYPDLANKPIATLIQNEQYKIVSILANKTREETGGQGGGNLYQTYRWSEKHDCDWLLNTLKGIRNHDLQIWNGDGTVDPPGWPAQ